MKVLVFTTQFFQLGGAERLAVELAVGLNETGIHADVVSMYGENLAGVAAARDALLEQGVPQIHFLGMRVHPSALSLASAIVRLRNLIAHHDYDIVETSLISPTIMAAWATMGLQVGMVAGIHQVYSRERDSGWRHRLLRRSVRANARMVFYGVSKEVARQWTRFSGTDPIRTRVVYNAVTDRSFVAIANREEVRRELEIASDARIAIYVGRLAAYKGIDTLVETLGPIALRENLYIICVGVPDLHEPGTSEMLSRLDAVVRTASWGGRIRFLGFRNDIPRLLAGSDVLVHPTRTEGFGLALVEALAAGLPVVASNVDGIPEVLQGSNSAMIDPDDRAALLQSVLDVLRRSPREAELVRTRGRKRANDFRPERRVAAMTMLFEQAIAEMRPV